jgi:hypothetical protein
MHTGSGMSQAGPPLFNLTTNSYQSNIPDQAVKLLVAAHTTACSRRDHTIDTLAAAAVASAHVASAATQHMTAGHTALK